MASNDSMDSIPSSEIIPVNQLRLRKPLLYYLKTNANPRVLLKLMSISTFFRYPEFPYMVIENLHYKFDEWEYFHYNLDEWEYFQLENDQEEEEYDHFDYITKPLWICNRLSLYGQDQNHLSRLLSKTAVCDMRRLKIAAQNLKMDEFKLLISSKAVEDFSFYKTLIKYDDGSIVPIEEIVRLLPNVKDFRWIFSYDSSEITSESTKKIIEYLNLEILNSFVLHDIPATFDFELFEEFMNENPSFCHGVPREGPPGHGFPYFGNPFIETRALSLIRRPKSS